MKIPSLAECIHAPSESFKYAHLVEPYLQGCGVDVGSQGWPVVPWAISLDLPDADFNKYCGGAAAKGIIHLRGHVLGMPFRDDVLDWVYSSHLIEDFPLDQWQFVIGEMLRCVKPGGYVVTICPEVERWRAYLENGGMPNPSHRHEGVLGDFAAVAAQLGVCLVEERLTEVYPGDYSMVAVMMKSSEKGQPQPPDGERGA